MSTLNVWQPEVNAIAASANFPALLLSMLCVLIEEGLTDEASLGRAYVAAELAGAAVVIGALVANNLYLRWGTSRSSA